MNRSHEDQGMPSEVQAHVDKFKAGIRLRAHQEYFRKVRQQNLMQEELSQPDISEDFQQNNQGFINSPAIKQQSCGFSVHAQNVSGSHQGIFAVPLSKILCHSRTVLTNIYHLSNLYNRLRFRAMAPDPRLLEMLISRVIEEIQIQVFAVRSAEAEGVTGQCQWQQEGVLFLLMLVFRECEACLLEIKSSERLPEPPCIQVYRQRVYEIVKQSSALSNQFRSILPIMPIKALTYS